MNIRYLRNTKVFPAALQQISCVNSSGSRIDLRGAWTLEGGRGAWPGPNPKNPMKMKEFSQTFPKVYFFTECRGRGGLGPPAPPPRSATGESPTRLGGCFFSTFSQHVEFPLHLRGPHKFAKLIYHIKPRSNVSKQFPFFFYTFVILIPKTRYFSLQLSKMKWQIILLWHFA